MFLLKYEFTEIANRPILWIGTIVFSAFLLHAVAHLAVGETPVTVALYKTPADSTNIDGLLQKARALLLDMAGVTVEDPKELMTDIASQMLKDQADIAVTENDDGWRFTIKSRSLLEHTQFVRVAQELGESLRKQKPWAVLMFDYLKPNESEKIETKDWPTKVQIAGITADPGRQARLFVPKTIALLAYFVTFAFATRGMIRDISNNMLSTILAASHGGWINLIVSKVIISVMMGLIVLWSLLLFAALTEGFEIKDGLYISTAVQLICLLVSAIIGIILSLLVQTEARIYFVGSAYLVLLILLSGLISRIEPDEAVLSWISNVLPLGYAMDLLSNWMFFGVAPLLDDPSIHTMIAFLVLAMIIVYWSVLRYKRSL
jgi:ABC-type multidrug transport system permease subunit